MERLELDVDGVGDHEGMITRCRCADWRGFDYALQPPESAIDPSEDAVSIDAAMAMRLAFLKDDRAEARAVLPLFDALIALLSGAGRCASRTKGGSDQPRSGRGGL
jgi:hypothetical protein